MAIAPESAYLGRMRADPVVVHRWRVLRQLLIDQLTMFESGRLTLTSGGVEVSAQAIERIKREIDDFDSLIAHDEELAARD